MSRKGLAVASPRKPSRNNKARPGPAKRGRGESAAGIRPKDKGSRSKAQSGSRSASAKKGRRIVEVEGEAVVPCYVDLILDIPADADDGDLGAILRKGGFAGRISSFWTTGDSCMANRLTMAKIQAILSLHDQKWRNRKIARELDVDRETVAKYVRAAACVPKPAKAPIGAVAGSERGELAKPGIDRTSPYRATEPVSAPWCVLKPACRLRR